MAQINLDQIDIPLELQIKYLPNLCEQLNRNSINYTQNPSSLDAIINKQYKIAEEHIPIDLVNLQSLGIQASNGVILREEAANQLKKMLNNVSKENIPYLVSSGWRSFALQERLKNSWVKNYGENIAQYYVATPGFSEHHLGNTFDIITPENNYQANAAFEKTRLGRWLINNAWKYGFVMSYPNGKEKITGYRYEPWHYRYVGITLAEELKKSNLTLTEFLYKMHNICE